MWSVRNDIEFSNYSERNENGRERELNVLNNISTWKYILKN